MKHGLGLRVDISMMIRCRSWRWFYRSKGCNM